MDPLVSICCLTYNHAPFVRKCLEGFLMQETTFPVEILIHDDASTDGTDDIIREYTAKIPDRIFPLFEEENQYSKGCAQVMDFLNYKRARGKYIAICEGDDYWSDPFKLQKQVDFMEAHPEYSVCFHRCKHWYSAQDRYADDACGALFANGQEGVDITMDSFFDHWITQPLSMLFRMADFSFEWQKKYKHYRDTYEIYHLLKEGKGWLFAFVGGVYNLHSNGVSSLIDTQKQYVISYEVSKELYDVNKDSYTKNNYANTLRWLISSRAKMANCSWISLVVRYLFLTGDFKFVLKKIIKKII